MKPNRYWTKTPQHQASVGSLCLLLMAITIAVSATTSATAQVTAEWINPAGGDWQDSTNWSTSSYPRNTTYDVVLGPMGQPYTVLIDWYQGLFDVGHLEISDPDATLRLDTVLNTFTATGGITNHGVIEMTLGHHISIGSTSSTKPADLLGTGVVRFLTEKNTTGTSYGQYMSFASDGSSPSPHIIGPGITVHAAGGRGSIYSTGTTEIKNQGFLWADGNTLTVSKNLTNTGTLRAGDGGHLTAGFIDGGLAGTLLLEPGGTIELGSPGDYELDQSVTVQVDTHLMLNDSWSIANGQSITVVGGRLDTNTDQPGLNQVSFNGGTLGIRFATDWPTLQSRVPVGTSRVLMLGNRYDKPPLDLLGGSLDLSSLPYEFGLEDGAITNGSILTSNPSSGALIASGKLSNMIIYTDLQANDFLLVQDSNLYDVSVAGDGDIGFTGHNLLDHVSLENDWQANIYRSAGEVRVVNGLMINGLGLIGPSTPLVFSGSQRIDGEGIIQLYSTDFGSPNGGNGPSTMYVHNGGLTVGSGVKIDISHEDVMIIATDQSIEFEGDLIAARSTYLWLNGTAYLSADEVIHHGHITVDAMRLEITANTWTLTDTATLEADLDLVWPTLIDVTGAAELDGELILTIDPEWTPTVGETVTLLDAGGGITGQFNTVTMPNGLNLIYGPTGLTVRVQLAGDLNGDGFVGIEDLNSVLPAWNQQVLPGSWMHGDLTGDGFVGIEDLNAVLANWNTGSLPPLALTYIPEPGTACLLGIGGISLLRYKKCVGWTS